MPFARPKKREPLEEPALFEYAVAALARRMRSVRDLRRLMQVRAQPGEAGDRSIDSVINRLQELNYLSDSRFAADFVRLRKENEKFGRRRVQQDLAQRGLPKELIALSLSAAYETVDETALAREYCRKKRLPPPAGGASDSQKQTSRLIHRLMRAGFSSTSIFRLLREWHVEIEESDVELTGSDETEDQAVED